MDFGSTFSDLYEGLWTNATDSQLGLALFSFIFFLIPCCTPSHYTLISNLHAIPAVTMGFLSMMEIIPEWVPIIFSAFYMIVDGTGMLIRLLTGTTIEGGDQTWQFVAHHFAVLPMYLHPIVGPPIYYKIKMTSLLLMIEIPNPFRFHWETTRKHWHFLLFFPIFILTRTFWLGWIVYYVWDMGGCGPNIVPLLWVMCQMWVMNNMKYVNKDVHDKEYNPQKEKKGQ